MKKISLDANVVGIPVGKKAKEMSEDELNKHIDELFDKYICSGMGIKPEDEIYGKLRVIRKIFNNGYRCGYNDMLSSLKIHDAAMDYIQVNDCEEYKSPYLSDYRRRTDLENQLKK